MKTITMIFLAASLTLQSFGQVASTEKKKIETAGDMQKVTWFYANGDIKMEGYLQDGLKQGTWTSYDENGKKTAESNWTDNKKDGVWIVWHENGTIHYNLVYEKGTRIIATEWDETGNVVAGNQMK